MARIKFTKSDIITMFEEAMKPSEQKPQGKPGPTLSTLLAKAKATKGQI